jgi:hypothetical protein
MGTHRYPDEFRREAVVPRGALTVGLTTNELDGAVR